ncbi:hypothetical protein SAMN04515618_11781 [Collimonas sp. OK307]|nr:hypothetical protein SAMN04515618_11781 [Collimonas sp. OK307]
MPLGKLFGINTKLFCAVSLSATIFVTDNTFQHYTFGVDGARVMFAKNTIERVDHFGGCTFQLALRRYHLSSSSGAQ